MTALLLILLAWVICEAFILRFMRAAKDPMEDGE
jgi:hypothetical protein